MTQHYKTQHKHRVSETATNTGLSNSAGYPGLIEKTVYYGRGRGVRNSVVRAGLTLYAAASLGSLCDSGQ